MIELRFEVFVSETLAIMNPAILAVPCVPAKWFPEVTVPTRGEVFRKWSERNKGKGGADGEG